MKYLSNECMQLLIWCIPSLTAVGVGDPEKLRRVSLMALEAGRGTSAPSQAKVGYAACLQRPCDQRLRNLGPCICRLQMLRRRLQLSVRVAPDAHCSDWQRNVLRAPSWAGTQQEGSAVSSTLRTEIFLSHITTLVVVIHGPAWLGVAAGPASRGLAACLPGSDTETALRSCGLPPAPLLLQKLLCQFSGGPGLESLPCPWSFLEVLWFTGNHKLWETVFITPWTVHS